MKIRNKITLLFTVLVTAILLILNIAVYYMTAVESNEVFNKRLKSRASNNAQIFSYFGDSSINVLQRIDATLAQLPQKTVGIYDTLGNILYSYKAELAEDIVIDSSLLKEITDVGEKYFKIGERNAVGQYYPDRPNFIIIVAAYDEDGRLRLTQLKKVLISSLLIGILVTLVTGFVFSSQLVKPIADISREVNAISSHDLSKRLSVGNGQDELNQLSITFNDLLNRLQESFTTQRRFISNASHELSTPLTSISSQLQVTLQKDRSTGEYQQVLQSIQEDVEQMRQLIKSLLEIAKTGSQGSIELKELRIDELLLKVITDIKRNNQQYEVELQFDDLPEDEKQCMVYGNFDLLYSALKNIIENGCKYSPDNRSFVKVYFHQHMIFIDVMNEGDVIAEEQIENIFQPFFRIEKNSEIKGFGLGLPLAKRIISMHKGEIKVNSRLAGTTFSISLPSILHPQPQI